MTAIENVWSGAHRLGHHSLPSHMLWLGATRMRNARPAPSVHEEMLALVGLNRSSPYGTRTDADGAQKLLEIVRGTDGAA